MAVTNYYTVNGGLIGEKTAGGTRTDYLTDGLGNVTATLNQSGQVVNTYRYKPYGAQLAKTGTGADPAFRWVGSQGYRQTGKKYSDVYVRARHYDSAAGRWASADLISYVEGSMNLYTYVAGCPVGNVDPSGLVPARACCCCPSPNSVSIVLMGQVKQNYTPQNSWYEAGHCLLVQYRLYRKPSYDNNPHDCTLQWFEGTKEPYPPFSGPPMNWDGSWTDLYALWHKYNTEEYPTWGPWGERTWVLGAGTCNATCTGPPIKDYPHFQDSVPDTDYRKLSIQVRILGGSGCGCSPPSAASNTFVQQIGVKNGQITTLLPP